MDEYPRTVKLDDSELKELLEQKEELVFSGRELSETIDEREKEMQKIDEEIQAAEKTADLTDINARAQEVTDSFNEIVTKMEAIKQEMFDRAKAMVPPELYTQYEAKKKEKEDLEIERNKIGLKIQQKNDKIIPIGRRAMKPHLKDMFEDYDTLRIENEEVIGTIFNHVDDFKKQFLNRKTAN